MIGHGAPLSTAPSPHRQRRLPLKSPVASDTAICLRTRSPGSCPGVAAARPVPLAQGCIPPPLERVGRSTAPGYTALRRGIECRREARDSASCLARRVLRALARTIESVTAGDPMPRSAGIVPLSLQPLAQDRDLPLLGSDHLLGQPSNFRVAAVFQDHARHVDRALVMWDHGACEVGIGDRR